MATRDKLTPTVVRHIAFDVRDGDADPEDARCLLEYFCKCTDDRMLSELTQHLQHCFRSFINGDKGLEAALGLAPKTGRPKADEEVRRGMAVAVLRLRMQGTSHQESLEVVAEQFECGKTKVGEAWQKHMQDALIVLRLERPQAQYPWTKDEVKQLRRIFGRKEWWQESAPEKYPK